MYTYRPCHCCPLNLCSFLTISDLCLLKTFSVGVLTTSKFFFGVVPFGLWLLCVSELCFSSFEASANAGNGPFWLLFWHWAPVLRKSSAFDPKTEDLQGTCKRSTNAEPVYPPHFRLFQKKPPWNLKKTLEMRRFPRGEFLLGLLKRAPLATCPIFRQQWSAASVYSNPLGRCTEMDIASKRAWQHSGKHC